MTFQDYLTAPESTLNDRPRIDLNAAVARIFNRMLSAIPDNNVDPGFLFMPTLKALNAGTTPAADVTAMLQRSPEKAFTYLAALQSVDVSTRKEAIDCLASIGVPAIRPLQELCDRTTHYETYNDARMTLKQIEKDLTTKERSQHFVRPYSEETTLAMIAHLGSENILMRARAVDRLLEMGTPALPILIETTRTCSDPNVAQRLDFITGELLRRPVA